MRLNRLEILGFKSFADKVYIEFKKGITTVVGPNGSGKSNISDAIRWVLGEQNAKTLRGGKMEDIIFSGTQTRRALGFAEVSLVLDNEEGVLPVEYAEVKITRKVYRSGESEYYINNQNCRLKDIQELFMDTGVGKEGYSIIGQGKIDEILSTKSEDRRNLFEEAAGIVKYKTRKNEAEKRLKQEKENLLRLEDIILELERQIEPLSQQSGEAKKYLNIKQELKEFEVNIFIHRSTEMKDIISQYDESLESLKNELNFLEHKKNLSNDSLGKLKKSQVDTENMYQEIQNSFFSLKSSIEKHNGEIKISEEKIHYLDKDLSRLRKDNVSFESKEAKLKEQIGVNEAKYNGIQLQLSGKNNELQKCETKYEEISKILIDNEVSIENYKGEIIEALNDISEVKSQVQHLQGICEGIENRKLQISKEINNLYSSKEIQMKSQQELHQRIEEKEIELNRISYIIKQVNEEKSEIQRDIIQNNKEYQLIQQQFDTKTSKQNLLIEMEKDFEGYNKSVKNILSLKKEGYKLFQGVCGSVAELIKVPRDFEIAIEIALGAAMQNIITEDEQDAKLVIDYMKSNQLGRATFLPISSVNSKTLKTERNKILTMKGIKGIASEIISFNDRYKGIVENLLGRVVVVENLDTGIALARAYKHSFKIVTMDGDVIHAGGSMTGGSVQNKTSSIFGRKREIEDLTLEIKKLEQKRSAIQLHIKNLQMQEEELSQNIEKNNVMYHNGMLIQQQLESELKASLKESGRIESNIKQISLELEQLIFQYDKVLGDLSIKNNKLQEMQEEISQMQEQVENIQKSFLKEKETKELILQSITNLKIEISSLNQEKSYVKSTVARLNEELKVLIQNRQHVLDEIQHAEKEQENLASIIQRLKLNIILEKEELDKCEQQLSMSSEQKKKNIIKIDELNAQLEAFASEISVTQEKIYHVNNKRNKVEVEEEALFSKMWEEYEITYSRALELQRDLGDLHFMQKKALHLKNELKKLGNVNIGAIEEYKKVKERYDFLTKQKNDILDAEQTLRKMIDEMTKLMQEQFITQFTLIANNFDYVFKELFGGGKAELNLSDQNDVLNAGIDIHVQPPGKKRQTLSLLSGGERALTAIAILFAILKVKPTPFCVLDEIEAALDDANVTRYAQYLKGFAQNTQFIIVTHRKGTMEVADALYGVTMQEHGVSKLISVEFEQAVV